MFNLLPISMATFLVMDVTLLSHVWPLFHFYFLMAVSSANALLTAVPFVLIMAVPFAVSFVADVPFIYYNGCFICNGCSFCYLISGRCTICINNGLLPHCWPLY
jgi:hypothetical protein